MKEAPVCPALCKWPAESQLYNYKKKEFYSFYRYSGPNSRSNKKWVWDKDSGVKEFFGSINLQDCFWIGDAGNVDTGVLDIDRSGWEAIKEAICESETAPEEHYLNDWISDIVRFVKGEEIHVGDKVKIGAGLVEKCKRRGVVHSISKEGGYCRSLGREIPKGKSVYFVQMSGFKNPTFFTYSRVGLTKVA